MFCQKFEQALDFYPQFSVLFCFQDLSRSVTLRAGAVFSSCFVQCVDGTIKTLRLAEGLGHCCSRNGANLNRICVLVIMFFTLT